MKYIGSSSFTKVLFIGLGLFIGCKSPVRNDWPTLDTHSGSSFNLTHSDRIGTAIMVLSPDCPLCISGSRDFQDLKDSFQNRGIQFIGLIPGNWYTNEEVQYFVDSVDFNLPIVLDENFTWSKQLGAKVTPHYFLLDSNASKIFGGPMDDRVMRLGKKRLNASRFYLKEGIAAYLEGTEIGIKSVKATGCIIEYE